MIVLFNIKTFNIIKEFFDPSYCEREEFFRKIHMDSNGENPSEGMLKFMSLHSSYFVNKLTNECMVDTAHYNIYSNIPKGSHRKIVDKFMIIYRRDRKISSLVNDPSH